MTFIIFNTIAFRSDDGALWNLGQPQRKSLLTTIPARLFTYLLENVDKIISREELLNNIWDKYGLEPSNNSVNQYISMIRKLLVELGCDEEIIQTLPRMGFFIEGGKVAGSDKHQTEKKDLSGPDISSRKPTLCWQKVGLMVFAAVTTLFLIIQPFSTALNATDYHFPSSKLYKFGTIDACPVYSLRPVPSEIAGRKEQLARNLSSGKLACVADAIFIFQSSERVMQDKTVRIFMTRCIQSSKNSDNFSDCKAIYDFSA
ncbi:transcriptional regulator [Enterobacter asburiae]|uniref:transcriptional regulator n=1 Tax=Enterobacter asburiae TaxID=61645 RepID=UPI0034CD9C0F